jgi:hypothetical protein
MLEPTEIDPRGYWLNENCWSPEDLDVPMATALLAVFGFGETVSDMGCGGGAYVDFLRKHRRPAFGYDGDPHTASLPNCAVCDLSIPINLPVRDWVLCLETAEHIPAEFEAVFMSNLDRHNRKGIVISWARPGQGGYGHFNERGLDYVRGLFSRLGYSEDSPHSTIIAQLATLPYYKDNTLVFRR